MNWLHTALRAQAAGEACPPLPQKTFASLPMAEREAFKSRFDRAYNQGAEALINVNESLLQSLMALNEDTGGKPKAIIAKTIKGKGFSFSEENNAWHHAVLTKKLYSLGLTECGENYNADKQ